MHTRLRPSSPWFDADCRVAHRHCRRLERRYHRSHSDTDRRSWVAAARSKLTLFQTKKNAYWLARVQEDSRSNRLWRSLSGILGRDKRAGGCSTPLDADHFSRKVADIRAAIDGSQPPNVRATAVTSMDVFQPVTEADVRRVIMASPSKSSSLDPIPTFLLKEVIDVVLPFITALVNASLSQGCLPMSQKQAIVTPTRSV